ncbi:MAG TPA: clostripain-related cysteine peptidase [Pyrinomonadaceae bacterium]|nr:clostripain-related cysteine peptidase [Pyrinomonadaceae bacterium]
MAKKAAWTVIVYLAGDNNLTTECMFALTEMKAAALGNNINVIAQFDPSDPYLPTHRYEIKRRGKNQCFRHDIIDRACYGASIGEPRFTVESKLADALAVKRKWERDHHCTALDDASLMGTPEAETIITDETDTGSPVMLYNFISFCLQKYKADHYLVVLSGHAGGTERDYLMKDESSAGSLTFNELKNVFQRVKDDLGRPIDILGMDNCLMSMAEICYELRGLAKVVVGCESFSPASGWPYREVLERLAKDFVKPKLARGQSIAEAAATAIVNEYVNYYAAYWLAGLSVTQSALNIGRVEKLHELIDRLAKLMERELIQEWKDTCANGRTARVRKFHDALLLAHWEAQSYNGEQFVDLFDFCDCLQVRLGRGDIAEQCRELKEFISKEFVLTSCYSGAAYQYSYGVSLYFPWSHVAPSYWNLDFNRVSDCKGWGSFLRTYTLLTRRPPRGVETNSRLAKALNGTIEDAMISVRMSDERMSDERMSDERMSDERMSDERMSDERMSDERMSDERMSDERMSDERMSDERMLDERMQSGLARSRVHSMRNPPNVFFPDQCIRNRRSHRETQERLRLR